MSENTAAATEQMKMPQHGEFCWNDLATGNIEGSKKFYGELFGWQFKDGNEGGMSYSEISLDGKNSFGGMWDTNQACEGQAADYTPPPPHWMSWVAVDDVDAIAAKVEELGGKICVPPTDIPNTGRFVVANDPSGAVFSMITLKSGGAK